MSAQTPISEIAKRPPKNQQPVAAFVPPGAAPRAEPKGEGSSAGIVTHALVPGRSRLPHPMSTHLR